MLPVNTLNFTTVSKQWFWPNLGVSYNCRFELVSYKKKKKCYLAGEALWSAGKNRCVTPRFTLDKMYHSLTREYKFLLCNLQAVIQCVKKKRKKLYVHCNWLYKPANFIVGEQNETTKSGADLWGISKLLKMWEERPVEMMQIEFIQSKQA